MRAVLGTALAPPLLLLSSSIFNVQNTQQPESVETEQVYPTYQGIVLTIDDDEMRESVIEALDLMQAQAPAHFAFVKAYIKEIRQAERSGMHVREGIFDLSKNSVTQPEWTASIIFHDAMHRYQYLNGLPYYGVAGETDASIRQLAFLELIKAPEFLIDHLKNVIENGDHSDLNGDGEYTHEDYVMRTWVKPQPLVLS